METGQFTISKYGKTTFSTDKPFIMPEGVTGYIVQRASAKVDSVIADVKLKSVYDPGNTVPARTPLLLAGTAGTYTYNITECDEQPPANNLLSCIFTADDKVIPLSGLYRVFVLSAVNDVPKFVEVGDDENNPGYYLQIIAVGKAYLLVNADYNEYAKDLVKTIGGLFDFQKIRMNMQNYSDRKKWLHKLKWLLGRIKSCKCGEKRHIGKLDANGVEESGFIKQLNVIFR